MAAATILESLPKKASLRWHAAALAAGLRAQADSLAAWAKLRLPAATRLVFDSDDEGGERAFAGGGSRQFLRKGAADGAIARSRARSRSAGRGPARAAGGKGGSVGGAGGGCLRRGL